MGLRVLADRVHYAARAAPLLADQPGELALRRFGQRGLRGCDVRCAAGDLLHVLAAVEQTELRRAPGAQHGHAQRRADRGGAGHRGEGVADDVARAHVHERGEPQAHPGVGLGVEEGEAVELGNEVVEDEEVVLSVVEHPPLHHARGGVIADDVWRMRLVELLGGAQGRAGDHRRQRREEGVHRGVGRRALEAKLRVLPRQLLEGHAHTAALDQVQPRHELPRGREFVQFARDRIFVVGELRGRATEELGLAPIAARLATERRPAAFEPLLAVPAPDGARGDAALGARALLRDPELLRGEPLDEGLRVADGAALLAHADVEVGAVSARERQVVDERLDHREALARLALVFGGEGGRFARGGEEWKGGLRCGRRRQVAGSLNARVRGPRCCRWRRGTQRKRGGADVDVVRFGGRLLAGESGEGLAEFWIADARAEVAGNGRGIEQAQAFRAAAAAGAGDALLVARARAVG